MSTHADTASSHSHSRLMPLVVVCPNDVEWHHRILFYILFQATSINQLGLATSLFLTLFVVQSPLGLHQSFLALCLWLGFLGGNYRRSESGRTVILGLLQQLPQVGCIPLPKDTTPENTLLNSRNCSSWFRGDNGFPVLPGVTFYPLSGPLNLAHIFVGKVFHKLPNLIISSCFLPGPWLV